MNKIKRVVSIVLLAAVMLVGAGCGVQTDIGMDENGKGTVAYRMAFKKNSIEDTEYTKFDTLEDLASALEKLLDNGTGIKVAIDRTSSELDDYIIVSYDYESVEDFCNNINVVLQKYNQLVVAEDVNGGMFGFNPFAEESISEYEIGAIEEYLEANGILVDAQSRNIRKFLKVLKETLCITMEFDEDYNGEPIEPLSLEDHFIPINKQEARNSVQTKDDSEFVVVPNVVITEKDGEKFLNMNTMAIYYLEMYIRRVLDSKQNEIFNTEYVNKSSLIVTGEETKEIFKRTFEGVGLADTIKKVLDEKAGGQASNYTMDDFSPVQSVQLFTNEYSYTMNKEYNKQYRAYQKAKEENPYEHGVDVLEELYNERDNVYVLKFGANEVTLNNDTLCEATDADNRITMSAKEGAGVEVKEHNNEDTEGLDETPWAGDRSGAVTILGIALLAVMMMAVTIFGRMRR